LSDVPIALYIGMSRTLNRINRDSEELFRRYKLTKGQFAVLEALYHKGDLSIGRVQELILTTGGNIPVLVKNLTEKGLLTKYRDETDHRRYFLHITETGKDLMEEVYPQNEALLKELLSVWTQEEQDQLILYFKKFRDATT
jgi:MarR family 2-MHQ and catechol resistance regulon transcriptional repressor